MSARIYVGTYAKYNDGNLAGAWLNCEDYADKDEFIAACLELHKDESDPELMFQDYEGFPEGFYGESHIDPALWDWLDMSEAQQGVLAAYQSGFYADGTLEQAEEAFIGTAENAQEFAQEHAYEQGANLKDWPYNCIDWEHAANDLRHQGFVFVEHEGETYVFDGNR